MVSEATRNLPRRIGAYKTIGRLAVGGMAELYLAYRRGPSGFRRPVAIKRMLHTRSQIEDAGVVTHAIMKNRYRVTVYQGRAPATRQVKGGKWFRADQLRRIPLTARARKALSLVLGPASDHLTKGSRARKPEPRSRSKNVVR